MAGSNWGEDWKHSHRKTVSTVRGEGPMKLGTIPSNARIIDGEPGVMPTMSIQEVQNAVNNGGNAAQTNVSGMPAAATATPSEAAQNAALNVSGVGNAGRGLFYGALGPSGQIADPTAFLAAAPGAYQSPYAAAMQQTMNGLLNPTPFRYDVNADGLYQQIKDNYVKQGRQAMMDTQGQSAALTGGYGNSYGAMAGQQAYQESLGNLAGMIPELQQIAWQQYQQGQDDQRNNLEAMSKLDAQEYARWADEQEKYQELLKTLPAQSQGMGGIVVQGGGGVDATALANAMARNGMSGNSKVIDPATWAATVEAIGNGTLSAMGVLNTIENGGSYKNMDTYTMREAAMYAMNPKGYGATYSQTARNFSSAHKANHSTKSASGTGSTGNVAVDKNIKSYGLNH